MSLSTRFTARRDGHVAIIGGGPAGMTTALLLARNGLLVSLFERAPNLGGLWSSELDQDGFFRGDNSCKVYQSSYHSTPDLFRLIGTDWHQHFTRSYDLTTDWLDPFVAAISWRDRRILGGAYLKYLLGRGRYHELSVADFIQARGLSEDCRRWMCATALGGIAGTLRMTMWELFHRMGSNIGELLRGAKGPLYWNSQPPNSPEGFLPIWHKALDDAGVVVHSGEAIESLAHTHGSSALELTTESGVSHQFEAIFLAIPPPALAGLLRRSEQSIAEGFGLSRESLEDYLRESVYEHIGINWFFNRELPTNLPLGGHNVRRGWHPILVQHPQYRAQLRPPARSVVVGSLALDTDFRHHRLGTLAHDHDLTELASILWEDERRVDPSLPEPIDIVVTGSSSATQIIRRGPLPIKAKGADVFLATNLHGRAPYFTASLESAIQAGAIAAQQYAPDVEQLAMGSRPRFATPWSRSSALPTVQRFARGR